ncbi:MAG TPA: hypothetical protein VHQ41_01275, partial [Patescibacteria group bacterium]|nr:hypothetical protein [Patescibacteria group bacterium]
MNTAPTASSDAQITDGTVAQVIGPVVDVAFAGEVPSVYTALEIDLANDETNNTGLS